MAVSQEDHDALRQMVLDLQQQILNQSVVIPGGQPPPADHASKKTLSKCPHRFNGKEPTKAHTFLLQVADYRTAEDITDEAALKSIAILLEDSAMAWWHTCRANIKSWDAFEAAFRKQYQPRVLDYKISDQIAARYQAPSENISEYVVVIQTLYQRMAQPPCEEEQVQRIFENLRPEYKTYLKDDIVTFDELCERGYKAEVTMEGIKKFKAAQPKKTDVPTKVPAKVSKKTPDGQKAAATSSDTPRPPRPRCAYCKIPGHTEDKCHKKRAATAATAAGGSSSPVTTVPAKGVHMIQPQPRLQPFAATSYNGNDIITLLDSGAAVSVIDRKMYEKMKDVKLVVTPVSMPISAVGHQFTATEQITFTLKVEDVRRKVTAIIADRPGVDLLLGVDFLERHRVQIDFSTGVWFFSGHPQRYPFRPDPRPGVSHVRTLMVPSEDIQKLLEEFPDVFSGIPGLTHVDEHKIELLDDRPICCKPYRYSPAKKKIIEEQIAKMLELGIIEPSKSPYAFPVVLVPKKEDKGGGWRFCVNYDKLNAITKKDVYPLSRMDDLLDSLQDCTSFSLIDLESGYWQIPMAEADKEKTAFTCHLGTFQFRRMPFGLCNAPSTFQRVMDVVLGGLKWKTCFGYLDDTLVATPGDHAQLAALREVLERLRAAGLTAKRSKCSFGLKEIEFLGHHLSAEGMSPSPRKIEAVVQYPVPADLSATRRFLGFVNWYRKFIPDLAKISEPLVHLTRKDVPFTWGAAQAAAFETLKKRLITAPVLHRPDYKLPFHVIVDACDVGLGATLTQKNSDGDYAPIAYISRRLTSAEAKYATVEKECLAILWAIEYFRPYLEGQHFTVETDHRGLQWLRSIKNPAGRLMRWALRLQEFDFNIIYRPGTTNQAADALSRCYMVAALDATAGDDPDTDEMPIAMDTIREQQDLDVAIQNLKQQLKDGKDLDGYVLEQDVLYKYQPLKDDDDGRSSLRIVIPPSLVEKLISIFHDHALSGHAGSWKTLRRLQPTFTWTGMTRSIRDFTRSCDTCQRYKSEQAKAKGLLQPRRWTQPWQEISADLLGPLPKTRRGHCHLLVFIDSATRFVEAFPVRNATSAVVAKLFLEEIVCRYGTPEVTHTDNGVQFRGKPFKPLCRELGISQRFTPGYHAQSNPTERSNRDLVAKLAIYCESHQRWDENLSQLLYSMRTATHQTTGHSPAYLIYGRHPRHPMLNWLNLPSTDTSPEQQRLGQMLAFAEAEEEALKQSLITKKYYDASHQHVLFHKGDQVLYRTHHLSDAVAGTTKKLQPRWEGPCKIIKVLSPVTYILQGQKLTFHVNDLKRYHQPQRPVIQSQPAITNPFTPHPGRPTRPHKTPAKLLSLVLLSPDDHGLRRNSQSSPAPYSRSEGLANPAEDYSSADADDRCEGTRTLGLNRSESRPHTTNKTSVPDVRIVVTTCSRNTDADADGCRDHPTGQRRRRDGTQSSCSSAEDPFLVAEGSCRPIASCSEGPGPEGSCRQGPCTDPEGSSAAAGSRYDGSCRQEPVIEDFCLHLTEGPYPDGTDPEVSCEGRSSTASNALSRGEVAHFVPANRSDGPVDTTAVPRQLRLDGDAAKEQQISTSTHRTCAEGPGDSRANPHASATTRCINREKREVEGHADLPTTSSKGRQRCRPPPQEIIQTRVVCADYPPFEINTRKIYIVVEIRLLTFLQFSRLKTTSYLIGGNCDVRRPPSFFSCVVCRLSARWRHLYAFIWRVYLNNDANDVISATSVCACCTPDGATVRLVLFVVIVKLRLFDSHAHGSSPV